MSVLLCSIRDYLKENYADEAQDRISNINEALWLVDRDGEKEGIRITLGNLDHECYMNLINSNLDEIENENLRGAYDYFYSKLEDLKYLDEIKKFHDSLLDQLIYVSITAEGHKDAYDLFEAMNNRGLSLSPIDLMKNYLLMEASKREKIDSSQESRIEQLWGDIIKNLDRLDTRNPAITFFRQYFMSSPLLGINEKITKNKLYDPHFINTIDKRETLEDLLLDIRKQSDLYKKMLTQNIERFNRSENAEINRLLLNAKTVSITSFTLFLKAFRELDHVEKIKSIIRKSNALLLRRQICEKYTGAHDTIFNHLAQVAFNKNNPIDYMKKYLAEEDRFPTDQQFKRYFKRATYPRNDRTKYILSKIEEEYYGHGGTEVVESRYEVHIEHILPERYGENLQELWLDSFSISKDEHENHKKKIGNLTLLEEDSNLGASNRTLKKKQKYYTKTDFQITQELNNYERWGVEKIKNRSEGLAEIATEIWSL